VGVDALAVCVPEAAPNFDDFLETGKDQIGFAGEGCNMEPIPESNTVNQSSH
jgi:hypothetical protein